MTKNLFFLLFKKNKGGQYPKDQERAQKLAEIGAQLRRFREEHSICLERVALVTMIRSQLLEAIEQGQLDQLPEQIYTQGLIKRYAEAMGVDTEPFADFFETESALVAPEKSSQRDLGVAQLRPVHLYLFYIFLIVCSVNGLSQLMHRSESPETRMARSGERAPSLTANSGKTQPKQSERPVRLVNQSTNPAIAPQKPLTPANSTQDGYEAVEANRATGAADSKKAAEVKVAQPPGSEPSAGSVTGAADSKQAGEVKVAQQPDSEQIAGPVTVNVMFKDASWVQIEVDGKTEFEGVLPPGTQRTWQAKEQLVVVAGNAGGILVAVNNGQAKQLGAPGVVKEVTFRGSNSQPAESEKERG